tara:strand:- start:809 stop:982 length:174 start_codon:yes stop_codon:yes gene_type:complete
MNITIGSPEILIICGTVLGVLGISGGLVIFSTIGCIAGVFRFASNYQENNKGDNTLA